MSKYARLEMTLQAVPSATNTVSYSLPEIESIIESSLPASAFRHAAWWSNTRTHSHASAWLDAGFIVDGIELGGWVCFRRSNPVIAPVSPIISVPSEPASQPPAPHALPAAIIPVRRVQDAHNQASRIVLISCVKTKRMSPSPARDLYTSAWFVKAKAYVERSGMPWFIVSAEYGLVHPDTLIAPYDRTLNSMPISERRAWASRVLRQIRLSVPGLKTCVLLAGNRYREFLLPALDRLDIRVELPMEGLRQGQQLQWLDNHS